MPLGLTTPTTDAVSRAIQEERADQLPSGINNFVLYREDHIAVVVLDGEDAYYKLILEFLLAGIQDPWTDEFVSLELTGDRQAAQARALLADSIGGRLPGSVDVRDWERNQQDYEPENFTRDGMLNAMRAEAIRMEGNDDAVLRVASEDCSAFISWLRNPEEYLEYEYELPDDLSRQLGGRDFVQLCTFKYDTLLAMEQIGSLKSATNALLDICLSHNRLVLIDHGVTRVDQAAARWILRNTVPRGFDGLKKWIALCRRALLRPRRGERKHTAGG